MNGMSKEQRLQHTSDVLKEAFCSEPVFAADLELEIEAMLS